jgi:glutamate synthase domain-containing protein 3
MEYIIEALAPTTELDFDRLPSEKQRIYRQIQATHIHASPDGPWFFIIARSLAGTGEFQLMGITDTAMLRPQVFALQEGEVSIGLICSEKQAIDATLASLAAEDPRFTPVADLYWNARGGSFTDGGAFLLTVSPTDGPYRLRVANKFGGTVSTVSDQVHCDLSVPPAAPRPADEDETAIERCVRDGDSDGLFSHLLERLPAMDFDSFRGFVDRWADRTAEGAPALGIEALTRCMDRRYPTGGKKRSSLLTILRGGLERIFERQPLCDDLRTGTHVRVTWDTRDRLRGPRPGETTLLIDARGFSPEGENCDAVLAVSAHKLGWRRLVHYNTRGTRFQGVGLGPGTGGLRIDCYDNPGDYLGSGMDGLEIHVHGNAQDQLCQISRQGKLVVYGDVGQTFLYGAKGGEVYVLGNAAGRPMINAVGSPRVVINGTALDFLAESFMAGDPHNGGGFAIVNGLQYDQAGGLHPLELPYPGGNLLSLASGGAIYIRDPHRTLVEEQLNGGEYRTLSTADWRLIRPYLEENERLFGIRIDRDLLTVDGILSSPQAVYRKVMPRGSTEAESEMEGLGG